MSSPGDCLQHQRDDHYRQNHHQDDHHRGNDPQACHLLPHAIGPDGVTASRTGDPGPLAMGFRNLISFRLADGQGRQLLRGLACPDLPRGGGFSERLGMFRALSMRSTVLAMDRANRNADAQVSVAEPDDPVAA